MKLTESRTAVTTNRDRAQTLLESGAGAAETRALAFAVLALVDAVEAVAFPALSIDKVGGGRFDPHYQIRPVAS